jgi:hypothetical protein
MVKFIRGPKNKQDIGWGIFHRYFLINTDDIVVMKTFLDKRI